MPGTCADRPPRNLGRLLFCATGLFVREKLRTVHAAGFDGVSEVHMALVQNLDLHGTRLTTIASRASMTKQSMLELVNKAEASGFVERRTDPDDRRAKIVAFTPAGLEMLDRVREGVAVAERRMAAVMEAGFMSVMNERLAAYVADAIPAPDELRMSARNDVWRMRSVHRVLLSASGAFVRDVLHVVHEGGFDAVSEVNLALFRNLDPGGTRLTEVASRARMTKQAMAELVDKAEQLGLVARRPDPGDGRAKIVVPSQAGLQLLDWHRRGVEAAERRLAAVTGTAFVTALRAQLTAYVAGADAAGTESAWSCQQARLGSAQTRPVLEGGGEPPLDRPCLGSGFQRRAFGGV